MSRQPLIGNQSLEMELEATLAAMEPLKEERFAALVALARVTAREIDAKIESVQEWQPDPEADDNRRPSGPSDRILSAYQRMLAELRVTPESLVKHVQGGDDDAPVDELDVFAASERPVIAEGVL